MNYQDPNAMGTDGDDDADDAVVGGAAPTADSDEDVVAPEGGAAIPNVKDPEAEDVEGGDDEEDEGDEVEKPAGETPPIE